MISDRESFKFNNATIKVAEGSCASYNIVYLFICLLCLKPYVGRTVRHLRTRVGEHRQLYYKILKGENFDSESDDFALGHHLYQHGCRDRKDFNKHLRVCILEICSPKVLEVKEHKYIHMLKSLNPSGINLSNPFAISLLYK